MEIIITKMVLCLLAALILGLIIGYLLARAFAKERYEPQISSLQEELEHNTHLLADKNALFEETKRKLLESEIKNESLGANVEDLTQQNEKLSRKIVQLEEEKNSLDEALQQKEQQIAAHEEEHSHLKGTIADLEDKYREAKEHLSTKIASLGALEEAKKGIETVLSEKETVLSDLQQKFEEKERSLEEMKEKLEESLQHLAKREEILKKIKEEKGVLAEKYQSLQNRFSSLRRVEDVNKRLQAEIDKAKKETALLKEKIGQKLHDIDSSLRGEGRVDPEAVDQLQSLEKELQASQPEPEKEGSRSKSVQAEIAQSGWWQKIKEKLSRSSLDIDRIYEEAKERYDREQKGE